MEELFNRFTQKNPGILPDMVPLMLEEILLFLDDLRDSGVTNMFGAGSYIEAEFEVSKKESKALLLFWMETFSERQEVEVDNA